MRQVRTWWDSTGTFSGDAEFISLFSGREVFLRPARGGIIHVPLDWFSREDQTYVLQQVVEESNKSNTPKLPFADIGSSATSAPLGIAATGEATPGAAQAIACPWRRFLQDCDVLCDTSYEYHPADVETHVGLFGTLKLSNGKFLRPEGFRLLKQLVQSYPDTDSRTRIVDGLTRLRLEYDEVDGVVRIEPLCDWVQPGGFHCHVSVEGCLWLDGHAPQAGLRFQYHGERAIRAERVSVVTEHDRWDSPPLNFAREKVDKHDVLEIAHLGLAEPGIFSLATKIAQAEKAVVRFRGRFHSDLVVTEDMKGDLRAVLGALVTLGLETEPAS